MKYEITISKSDQTSECVMYYFDIYEDDLMNEILMSICEVQNEYIRKCKSK